MVLLCGSKLNGRIYFAGRFFRVFDRGQNNCYFDSAVKNMNTPQFFFLRHRLVLTGTIHAIVGGALRRTKWGINLISNV